MKIENEDEFEKAWEEIERLYVSILSEQDVSRFMELIDELDEYDQVNYFGPEIDA